MSRAMLRNASLADVVPSMMPMNALSNPDSTVSATSRIVCNLSAAFSLVTPKRSRSMPARFNSFASSAMLFAASFVAPLKLTDLSEARDNSSCAIMFTLRASTAFSISSSLAFSDLSLAFNSSVANITRRAYMSFSSFPPFNSALAILACSNSLSASRLAASSPADVSPSALPTVRLSDGSMGVRTSPAKVTIPPCALAMACSRLDILASVLAYC